MRPPRFERWPTLRSGLSGGGGDPYEDTGGGLAGGMDMAGGTLAGTQAAMGIGPAPDGQPPPPGGSMSTPPRGGAGSLGGGKLN